MERIMTSKNILGLLILGIIIFGCSIDEVAFCEEETLNQAEFFEAGVRDPFVSLLPAKRDVVRTVSTGKTELQPTALPTLSVQGLIWGSNKPQAIINNKVFNIGDQIEGAKIIEISKDGVKLSYQDKIFLAVPEKVKTTLQKTIGGKNENPNF
jgi:hypothetical protein